MLVSSKVNIRRLLMTSFSTVSVNTKDLFSSSFSSFSFRVPHISFRELSPLNTLLVKRFTRHRQNLFLCTIKFKANVHGSISIIYHQIGVNWRISCKECVLHLFLYIIKDSRYTKFSMTFPDAIVPYVSLL